VILQHFEKRKKKSLFGFLGSIKWQYIKEFYNKKWLIDTDQYIFLKIEKKEQKI